MVCEKCFYNRKIKVWGETLKACYYKKENKKDLYEIDGKCTGFKKMEESN